ncbi:2OG-Fe(II) oxygenase family protein [Actinophytocola glycyrrhizae]|uniref:2OG-Fe(II) oxygenase family protein n=1 Tax=Actinophytocola glycyrrhizae TaxID=2044873 RepID=A0ABV9S4Q0_9PSEU
MLVLADRWRTRRAGTHPYPWLATPPGELFGLDVAEELAATFPADGFVRKDAAHRVRGKTYRNFSRPVTGEQDGTGPLPPRWTELLTDLRSPEYRAWVADVLGQEPADDVELRLVRHSPGDWLGPHTDREDKIFSHILYFNPGWRADWGGCLEILERSSAAAVAGRVVPELGASALLAQAPNSWHQVTAVSKASAESRRSLLVHGLRR